jgi:cytochrome oxidase Cu insertion factor (SCO1/SenC/PrrC family)
MNFQSFLALVALAGTFPALRAPAQAAGGDSDYEAPAPGSYTLPVIKLAGDGEVVDSQNRSLPLRNLTHGRVTVMSFIYTRCAVARACPYATGVLMQLHQQSQDDPALAKGMRLVSISFDPAGDTPERMAAYSALARTNRPAAEWQFVTTRSQVQLQPILDAYGQAVDQRTNSNDPQGPLYHILRVFLIDSEGQVRNIYSSGTLDPRLILADVKTLLSESTTSRSKPPAPILKPSVANKVFSDVSPEPKP